VIGIRLLLYLCLRGRMFRGETVWRISFGGGVGCVVEWWWWWWFVFEVVVAAAMMCGRGGVSVCLGVRGAVLVGFRWVIADQVSKRFADRSFFKGWLDGGCFLWWLW
jgi:hypothetical protein